MKDGQPFDRLNHRRSFVFISSNPGWGGSEELWSSAAAELASQGHRVDVYKAGIDGTLSRIRRLRELSCKLHDLEWLPIPRALRYRFERMPHAMQYAQRALSLWLRLSLSRRPDLIIVSQGANFDGMLFADFCRRLGRPYVLIAQKASEVNWPPDRHMGRIHAVYAEARWCFFVSDHNLHLTEDQIGTVLPRASVVSNPFLVPWEPRNDWPDDHEGLRLACVARLFPIEKGQDLLLKVLARDKWRNRPLTVTFCGTGASQTTLSRLAAHHGLTSVTFAGFVNDVSSIWTDHHALILPSRCEGLPLAIVEAMLSGRVAIVTDVGGNKEVVDDGVSGFVAGAATEDSLDEAMERAWRRRHEWRAIGAVAAEQIRFLVPENPAREFAAMLERVASGLLPEVAQPADLDLRSAEPPERYGTGEP